MHALLHQNNNIFLQLHVIYLCIGTVYFYTPCMYIILNLHYVVVFIDHVTWTTCHMLSCVKSLLGLKGHCIELKYYVDGIHYGLTPLG